MKKRKYQVFLFSMLCFVISPSNGQQEKYQGQLSKLTETLSQSANKMTGQIVERTTGRYVFVPESIKLPVINISNPKSVSPTSVGKKLSVNADIDVKNRAVNINSYNVLTSSSSTRKLELELESGHSAGQGSTVISQPTSSGMISPVVEILNEYRSKVSRALQLDVESGSVLLPKENLAYIQINQAAEEKLQEQYQQAVVLGESGKSVRTEVVQALVEVRQEQKSIYGEYDNYPPWSYNQIFNNAKSVVAIAEPGQSTQALCSGVLIAKDYVLTAGHCFKNHDPNQLEVWFGFAEESIQGSAMPKNRYAITELIAPPPPFYDDFLNRASEERFDNQVSDFAIVKISRPTDDENTDTYEPQCMRKHFINRQGGALYVIGYPKGQPQMVHDNGQVYLPYRLTAREFNKLKLEIEADFFQLEEDQRIALLDEFISSYVETGEGADKKYELHDTRWGNQPKIGIVADLFRGNSGSPVFDRVGHCIIGIHTGGSTDTGQRLGASWQTHETVLPIQSIISQLGNYPETASLLDSGILIIK